ncbi:MAG: right-handed parallel beta-helix repeat-containing protein, partial [Promethearchaeota archaeon]
MHKTKILLLFLILCVNSSTIAKENHLPYKTELSLTKRIEARQFSPHDPISIFSDEDFDLQGFPGSGTVSDPYRIEGYNITSSKGELILIRYTRVYFMIKNNLLNGLFKASSGIKLIDVDNGIIESNYISNHTSNGIDLHFSNCNIIYDNAINNNFNGIRLREAHINHISKNIIRNNKQSGISIDDSDLNIFSHNVITENQLTGILSGGVKNIISANLILNNSFQG